MKPFSPAAAKRLQTLFALTPYDYGAIQIHQNAVCAICLRPPKEGGNRLSVDHCHATGLVRGLLCLSCNAGLAKFRDDVERLQRAAEYLSRPPATSALGAPRYGSKGRVTNKAATRKRLNRVNAANDNAREKHEVATPPKAEKSFTSSNPAPLADVGR